MSIDFPLNFKKQKGGIYLFYEKIIAYCERNSLTISSFEKMCGIGNGTIRRWKGEKSNPSLQTLNKISAVTGIPLMELIGIDKPEKEVR